MAKTPKQTSREVTVTVTDKTEYRIIGSDTEPGVNYVVTVVNDIPRSCDCASFTRTIKRADVEAFACKHMNRVYAQIEQATNEGTKPEWLYGVNGNGR